MELKSFIIDDLNILVIINFIFIFFVYYYRFKISNFLGILDKPNKLYTQKIHKKTIPLIGGVLFFILIINFLILEKIFYNLSNYKFSIYLISYFLFFILGFLDDRKPISPSARSIILIGFLLIFLPLEQSLILTNLKFISFDIQINLKSASIFFTVFCIFVFFNALNFSDGINGAALSICILINFYILLVTKNIFDFYVTLALIIILFANLKEFLFLGNSGTCLLSIYLSLKLIDTYNSSTNLYCDQIFLLLIFPGIDLIRTIFMRLINNKKIYMADKTHFHHYLLERFNPNQSWIFFTLLSILPISIFAVYQNFVFAFTLFLIIYSIILIKLLKKNKR